MATIFPCRAFRDPFVNVAFQNPAKSYLRMSFARLHSRAGTRAESLRGNHLAGVLIATRKAIKQALSLAN